MATSTTDIDELLRDARAGLGEWWSAVRGIKDNPLYHYLDRTWSKRSGSNRWHRIILWMPPFMSITGLGYVILRFFTATTALIIHDRQVVAILFAAIAIFSLWLLSGLYHTARDTLLLLGNRECQSPSDIRLDESVMAVRLTDRDFIVAMLANTLPRLYLRFMVAPLVALGGLIALQLWLVRFAEMSESATYSIRFYGLSATVVDLDTVAGIVSNLPISVLKLMLIMIPAALIMLLWLLALGRSLRQRWQVQLLALSFSLAQVLWIPLSFMQIYCWVLFTNGAISATELILNVLAPIIVIAILVATLHFSKNRPGLRLILSVSSPVLCLIAPLVALHFITVKDLPLHLGWLQTGNIFTWALSSFALVNPMSLLSADAVGVPAVQASSMQAFFWFRVPVILLIQLISLAICAHAARLAVHDWRMDEA